MNNIVKLTYISLTIFSISSSTNNGSYIYNNGVVNIVEEFIEKYKNNSLYFKNYE